MKDKLKEIINTVLSNNNLEVVLDELKSDANLRDDLGLDSISLAELTVRIEDEFKVDIFENGIISTVGEILNILENEA